MTSTLEFPTHAFPIRALPSRALPSRAFSVRRPVAARSRPGRVRALLVAAALVGSAACRPSEEAGSDLPEERIEALEFSLLVRPELREVLREDPSRPVVVGSMSPGRTTHGPGRPLPALEMPAPAEVAIDVPALGDEAEVRFAAGVATGSYADPGCRLRFEADYRGQRVFEWETEVSADVPEEERVWQWGAFTAGSGGRLVLRTDFAAPHDPLDPVPRAGFAMLEVAQPRWVQRTLATSERPNVLLVLVDTLRPDRLHAYGSERSGSPHVDALAERGLLYERAVAPSPWTLPSTTALLVQSAPHELDLFESGACYLSDDIVTLAEAFREGQCATAAFVTNPMISIPRNFDQGFDHFTEMTAASAGEVVDDVERWLDEHDGERFFLFLHLFDPHAPYEPPADLRESIALDLPAGYSEPAYMGLIQRRARGREEDAERLDSYGRYNLSLYDAEITGVDRELGRLFESLERRGLVDRTLIAFTSDHGEEFLEHGMKGHSKQLFGESVRVPLILAGPGVPVGERIPEPVENRFLGPTLLRLAGIEPRANLAGPDLLDRDVVRARAAQPIFFSTELGRWYAEKERRILPKSSIWGVAVGEALLMWLPEGPGSRMDRYRLYSLEADPGATVDIAGERPDVVQQMRSMIEEEVLGLERESVTLDFLRGVGYAGDD